MMSQTLLASEESKAKDSDIALIEAKVYLASGEIEKARSLTEEVLAKDGDHDEGVYLLSQIIDREIALEKEGLVPAAPVEELTAKEKQLEVDRWLERAKSMASFHQFEQAILAAEKVFLYQPQNIKASRLIDEIQAQAYKEGTTGASSLDQSAKEEAKDRIKHYQSQALQWLSEKKYGGARLALDKVLLLDPVNEEAIQLKNKMRELLENEKGKTL